MSLTKTLKKTRIETKPAFNQLICGDAFALSQQLDNDVIDCTITSPPYYNLRNYADDKQIGQEKTAEEYIKNLTVVFREIFRATNPKGTLWLNLGDTFDNGKLLGIPWRVALALQEVGWRLRCDIIWHKPNAMPSSVKNRPTIDHEYVFLFSKAQDYFYNADAIREPHITFTENSKMKGGRGHLGRKNGTPEKGKNSGNQNLHDGRWDQAFHPLGRNKRTVWSIPTGKFREAHFAVFPEQLVLNCVKAGTTPEMLVLDPFIGSGTTAVVSKMNGRKYLGFDINPEYIGMAEQRIINTLTPLIAI